jgi:hypothetical protein
MGPEILGGIFEIVGAILGLCLLVALVVELRVFSLRPFVLPTIVASSLWASFWCWYIAAAGQTVSSLALMFLFFFGTGAVLFGLHAQAIKWLLAART